MTREELKAAAVAMLDRAYVPYSHFPVSYTHLTLPTNSLV